jgi:hypothetical protein
MIYLASPYSHPDPLVRKARFDAACRATADLIRARSRRVLAYRAWPPAGPLRPAH